MLYTSNNKNVKRLSEKTSNRIIATVVTLFILGMLLGGAIFK